VKTKRRLQLARRRQTPRPDFLGFRPLLYKNDILKSDHNVGRCFCYLITIILAVDRRSHC